MNRVNSSYRRSIRILHGAAFATLLLAGSNDLFASDWKWSVTPYLWATDVGVDVAIDDRDVVSAEIPIEELVKDVETIAQVRFEGQRGAHGFFGDLFDVTLADEPATISLPNGSGVATFEPEMGMTILDLGGLYDPNADQEGFQLLYGARILDQRAEIEARADFADGATAERTYDIDDTVVDGLVGVRYIRRIGERWSAAARADVSTGGTELTWSANPSIGYSFGESGRYTAFVGYRTMEVDFDTADTVDAKMKLSGAYAGFRFSF
jgi:hypothetical protein